MLKFYKKSVKIILSVLVLISILLLVSCSSTPTDYLAFKSYPMSVIAALSLRESLIPNQTDTYEVLITLTDTGKGTLTFSSPERLKGLAVYVGGENGTVMEFDGMKIEIAYGIAELACAAVNIFSVTADNMVSTELRDVGGARINTVTFDLNGSPITFYYDEAARPLRAEYTLSSGVSENPILFGSDITLTINDIIYN